ncbi:sodium/calcium exchanger 1-like isoform X2 [Acanthaster planci]|uniref:Sodium/calcium exchanger 1-like isoform X2 n=1 Tax=Acanthaster planci TaxID=133434 RepID=A0A8B7ZKI0_ACAPL|nr:sodium/calcium exchanger 1-like isoform X2 [Acanthaster planci]
MVVLELLSRVMAQSKGGPVVPTLLMVVLMQVGETLEQTEAALTYTNATTSATSLATTPESDTKCRKGLILPIWQPEDPGLGDKIARAIVYFAALCFMFLGVSIIADRFMSAIEVITSKEREVTVKRPNGEVLTVSVRIWNETVSNLTLMALGSSAPEILLSIIEVCGNKFQAGRLGPSTIVGSAAFNLFVIIAVCVSVIPNGEVRRIKHLRVFMVTASVSLFAYIWLYLILEWITPGVIDLWEAIVTLMMFPLTVLWAYVADKRIFFYRFLRKKYKAEKVVRRDSSLRAGAVELGIPGEANANHFNLNHDHDVDFHGKKMLDALDSDVKDLEETRKETVRLLRELRAKHPDADLQALEQMANYEALNQQQKSRAFYRIQATRRLCGAGNILKKTLEKNRASIAEVKIEVPQEDSFAHIFFEPAQYTVMENVGSFNITVTRQGGNMTSTIYVDYRTEDATANAGSDYHYAEGTLIFKPGDTQKDISLTIIDDDIFEEDEHFIVRLSNVRVGGPDGMFHSNQEEPQAKLVEPYVATITILDDDHAGIFQFEEKEVKASESVGTAQLKVVRSAGARGTVRIPYRTIEGTAKGNGVDYIDVEGELEFENDETWKFIEVTIIDDEEYEKEENFYVELGQPKLIKRGNGSDNESYTSEQDDSYKLMSEEDRRIADLGKPQLGEITRLNVKIMESTEFKNTVDKLIKKTNVSLVVGTSSWREQFVEALTVSAGDDDEDGGEEKLPSCGDYVMHFLTIFWKLLFAIVPPTDLLGGYACFVFSIVVIGVLTAFIGDLAEHFGCTIGLKASVTAISFVALGTSVPDTFASKVAAVGDKHADASIGNVTGSNAVNVFLGIGVAWTMAAIANHNEPHGFEVDPGALGFSVMLFTILAVVAIITLMVRRKSAVIAGELGGPSTIKWITSGGFFLLWLVYVILCSLVAYDVIIWTSKG